MHNPNGGGYKKNQYVHKDRKRKLIDKLITSERLSNNDIQRLLNLEEEE